MTESFSDLWASSKPIKSEQPQLRTLGAAASSRSGINATRRATPDAFSMLASAGSSQPNSRPITPSAMRQPTTTRNGTNNTGDAFGGLVSFGGSTSEDGSLTIAELATKAERVRREKAERDEAALQSQGSFWDQYERPSAVKHSLSLVQEGDGGEDDDILGSLAKPFEPLKDLSLKPIQSSSAPPRQPPSHTQPSPPPHVFDMTVSQASSPIIDASPSALAASSTHKTTGTEYFKLGRFAEAETAYSNAIISLPADHLLCVPLYNNRALSRFKTGNYKGIIEDTSEVLRIITGDAGTAWSPERESAGAGASLGDAVSKALRRRAQAYECLEKWNEATSDWESLSAKSWVGHALQKDAVKGARRCRCMDAGDSNGIPSKMPIPLETSPSTSPSEALSRVRAANTVQEEEDQARHELKDIVDARLTTWRAGKETNLRALIASLDTVLWPTLGWQKVSMAELVSPGQVKVRYTKAIAKLHPDKLNVNNTTLEQRMIANDVFGTLNEAWNAFR